MEVGSVGSVRSKASKKVAYDAEGRLLKDASLLVNEAYVPEDLDVYVSKFQTQTLSAEKDWAWTTNYPWPELSFIVKLKRLDIFQTDAPLSQLATTDLEESHRIRNAEDWYPVRSLFLMDRALPITKQINIEATGPPKRHRFKPHDKSNPRDFTGWLPKETIHAFVGADRIPGVKEISIDYCDLPDRYFLTTDEEPELGRRRLFRFGAYSATQYYICEKKVFHEALDSEGGSGMTYIILPGPTAFAKKGWRVIGSFFGFDEQLTGSMKVTVYTRTDPFERMLIALAPIEKAWEWDGSISFYAFDIPVPSTMCYTVHHCNRSIYSISAVIPRHRMTTEDPRTPWEFRMRLYVMPASLEDCNFTTDPDIPAEDEIFDDDEEYSYS